MTWDQWAVNLGGAVLILAIAWYFWWYRKPAVSTQLVGGVQEVRITVKGGYDPDVIRVRKGIPVRLHFTRQESASCSEMVLFDKLGKSARLPEGQTVQVEFTPTEEGEIPFQCQMGMLRGKVVVSG